MGTSRKGGLSRRAFLRQSALAGAVAAGLGRRAAAGYVAPNEQVGMALIGCGGMGSRHLEALAVNPQVRLLAVCDVVQHRYREGADKAEELSGTRPQGYQDFRALLERDDIDGIFVATPDHWHPLLTILGCQAGKDVYVEKPACTTVEEGRAMIAAARRYGRVVQLGTQQRSMPVFQRAIDALRQGRIGQITSATSFVGVNGFNEGETPAEIPEDLNWDLWLGPAPEVPFSMERFGGWMGWHDYARGGELTNWGVHLMDILHWGIGQDTPLTVQAAGGSYREGPGADNYETIAAVFDYPGCLVTWEQRHENIKGGKAYGIQFNGTEGQLFVDRGSFVITRQNEEIERWEGEPEKTWANTDHHNNFFHCIRTRERPVAEIEQGVHSTIPVLLAGIALKTRRRLVWDAARHEIVGDPMANRYLTRAYRAPWHL